MNFHAGHTLVDHKGEAFKVPESPNEELAAKREGREPKTLPLRAGSVIANHILSSQHAPKDKVARVVSLAIKIEAEDNVELSDEDSRLLKDMLLAEDRMSVWLRGYLAWLVAPDSYAPEERKAFEALQLKRAPDKLAS